MKETKQSPYRATAKEGKKAIDVLRAAGIPFSVSNATTSTYIKIYCARIK